MSFSTTSCCEPGFHHFCENNQNALNINSFILKDFFKHTADIVECDVLF